MVLNDEPKKDVLSCLNTVHKNVAGIRVYTEMSAA
jgi:hypothetical protein